MATAKKPVAKATAKKPVKKTAVKKPGAKAPAKKPAAKKPGAKAPAKKPAVKKAAPAKKPGAKAPAKKTAAKKPGAKAPAKKTAAKKPAAKKAAPAKKVVAKATVKKAVAKATEPKLRMPEEPHDVKSRNLFDAFAQGKLPFAQGYIVSSFFSENTAYSIYEVISYAGVKEIFPTESGLQFVTGGKKLYILVEPAIYQEKFVEPVSRVEGEKIPKRFNELEIVTASNQTKVMVAKEPNETYGSFTVLKPKGINFAVVFYELPDIYKTLETFFTESLNKQRRIPEHDAKKAAHLISTIVEKYMGFKGEYA